MEDREKEAFVLVNRDRGKTVRQRPRKRSRVLVEVPVLFRSPTLVSNLVVAVPQEGRASSPMTVVPRSLSATVPPLKKV